MSRAFPQADRSQPPYDDVSSQSRAAQIPSAGGVLIRLDEVRRPTLALELWRSAHEQLTRSGAPRHALESYTFKQSRALALLEALGWQHEQFFAKRQNLPSWVKLSEEVMDAIECATSLLELEPESVAGERLLFSLVRRVPALNQALRALPMPQRLDD